MSPLKLILTKLPLIALVLGLSNVGFSEKCPTSLTPGGGEVCKALVQYRACNLLYYSKQEVIANGGTVSASNVATCPLDAAGQPVNGFCGNWSILFNAAISTKTSLDILNSKIGPNSQDKPSTIAALLSTLGDPNVAVATCGTNVGYIANGMSNLFYFQGANGNTRRYKAQFDNLAIQHIVITSAASTLFGPNLNPATACY